MTFAKLVIKKKCALNKKKEMLKEMSSTASIPVSGGVALASLISFVAFIILIIVVVNVNKIQKTVNNINESTVLGSAPNETLVFNLSASETESHSFPVPGGWCVEYIDFTSFTTTTTAGDTKFKVGTTSGADDILSLRCTGLGSGNYYKLNTNSSRGVDVAESCFLADSTVYLTLVNQKATSLIIQAHIYYRTVNNYASC